MTRIESVERIRTLMKKHVGPLPICHCGRDRTHPDVQPERHYGFWSWVLLLSGASGTPRRIDFRCQRCRQIVESTSDSVLLERYRH